MPVTVACRLLPGPAALVLQPCCNCTAACLQPHCTCLGRRMQHAFVQPLSQPLKWHQTITYVLAGCIGLAEPWPPRQSFQTQPRPLEKAQDRWQPLADHASTPACCKPGRAPNAGTKQLHMPVVGSALRDVCFKAHWPAPPLVFSPYPISKARPAMEWAMPRSLPPPCAARHDRLTGRCPR